MGLVFINHWLQWLENTSLSVAIRQSLWMYPGLEIIHIIGITLLVGAAFMFDLRLLGISAYLPVAGLADHLLPWSRRGLALVIPSGMLLFITNAQALSKDPTFWVKMLLLLLAGINAAIFHQVTFRSSSTWNERVTTPTGAKIAALASIILWIAVITCGRLLAY
jgi:predicted membrane protein